MEYNSYRSFPNPLNHKINNGESQQRAHYSKSPTNSNSIYKMMKDQMKKHEYKIEQYQTDDTDRSENKSNQMIKTLQNLDVILQEIINHSKNHKLLIQYQNFKHMLRHFYNSAGIYQKNNCPKIKNHLLRELKQQNHKREKLEKELNALFQGSRASLLFKEQKIIELEVLITKLKKQIQKKDSIIVQKDKDIRDLTNKIQINNEKVGKSQNFISQSQILKNRNEINHLPQEQFCYSPILSKKDKSSFYSNNENNQIIHGFCQNQIGSFGKINLDAKKENNPIIKKKKNINSKIQPTQKYDSLDNDYLRMLVSQACAIQIMLDNQN